MDLKSFFKECNSYKGRWNRKKFWLYPIGLSILIFIPLFVIFFLVGLIEGGNEGIGFQFISIIFILAYLYMIYITILAYIKRLHDLGKTGWWSIINFIPLLNIIIWIYCGFFKGTPGKNKFGDNPLENVESGKKEEKNKEL